MKKLLSGLIMLFALSAPAVLCAQRYYDPSHKDYHEWNSGEDTAYHRWLKETHKKDHDWAHATKREQRSYWAWRHDHPDH